MTTPEKAGILIGVACIIGHPAVPSSPPELTGEAFTETANLLPGQFIARLGGFGETVRRRSYDEAGGGFRRV